MERFVTCLRPIESPSTHLSKRNFSYRKETFSKVFEPIVKGSKRNTQPTIHFTTKKNNAAESTRGGRGGGGTPLGH